MWDYRGRKLHDRNDVNSVRDLERALHEELAQTPAHFIQIIICAMRLRCLAVIQASGGHTRYCLLCDSLF